jgi:hypothetical protein
MTDRPRPPRLRPRRLASAAVFVVLVGLAARSLAEATRMERDDLEQLREIGAAPDADSIRELLAPTPPTEEDLRLVRLWVAQLGGERYAQREAAAQKLLEMGDDAIPAVERATASDDPETRLRAQGLLPRLRLQRHQRNAALSAAVRTIARERLKGLASELLDLAPHLSGFAARNNLRRALAATVTSDDRERLELVIGSGPATARELAIYALPAVDVEPARGKLTFLLDHESAVTRLVAAETIAPYVHEKAFPVLIAGLESNDLAARREAVEVLRRLTG